MTAVDLQGLLLLFAFLGLMLGSAATSRRWPATFRPIAAFEALGKAIERAVEAGERVHVSLGTGSVIGPESAPAFAGLAALSRIARATSMSDRPAVVTAGDGAMAILARDTLRSSYGESGSPNLYDPTSGRLLGPTPFSYVAGLPSVLTNEGVSVHMLSGFYGFEAGLAAEFGERARAFVIGGTSEVQSQALLYAVARNPLLGEEVFASGAYLGAGELHKASLRTQDIIRIGLIVLILLGVLMATFEDLI
ncbi:MAG: hypothetical protein IIA51_04645 [Chloroflexi bacterium]|nr:hypothetical protein [Chloroflexota bacterium]MCH8340826.1 hypothetical protein [Chloroflexota bacterium]